MSEKKLDIKTVFNYIFCRQKCINIITKLRSYETRKPGVDA